MAKGLRMNSMFKYEIPETLWDYDNIFDFDDHEDCKASYGSVAKLMPTEQMKLFMPPEDEFSFKTVDDEGETKLYQRLIYYVDDLELEYTPNERQLLLEFNMHIKISGNKIPEGDQEALRNIYACNMDNEKAY